jgi:hypothetical protein
MVLNNFFIQPCMTKSKNVEVGCRDLIPKEHWPTVMSALAQSIGFAHESAPNRWGIRWNGESIMLSVGKHEVFQVGPWENPIHIIVDRVTVPANLRTYPGFTFSNSREFNSSKEALGYYSSNPGSEACDFGYGELARFYSDLSSSHAEIIRRAGKTPRHPSTKKTHCPELVSLIEREAGRKLPQPDYLVPDSSESLTRS